MTHSAELIVIWITKVGEKSVVVHTLSGEWGRRSFITGAASNRACLQPLSIIDAEITENSKSELWRMKSISAAHPLLGLRTDVRKSAVTMFISEVLFRTVKDGVCEDGLYEWCRKSILTLDALDKDFSNYHLRFLMEFAAALGFLPTVEDLMPFAGDRLPEIRSLLTLNYADSLLLPLSGSVRNEIADIMIKYISCHTETNINIRSLSVLRELFNS